jgi:hypothetical protein
MKTLVSTMIAIAMTAAAGVAFAEEDEAMDVAPNAKLVIISSAPTGPARYDQDEAMDVAPAAQMEVEQTTYTWGSYPTD